MTSSKKALIVSPYLDHLGGGERYMLVTAQTLESLGYQIFFGWDNLEEITRLATMLGINLKNPQLDPAIKNLYVTHNPISMFLATRPYDVVFYLSDGSLPLLGSRRNLVHMQVPFHGVGGKSLKNKLKKMLIHHVVVNSAFTKKVIDQEYDLRAKVLYPPVTPIKPGIKTNQILSVGRFEPSLNAKHQDVLIEAFKLLSPRLPQWKLVLAGGSSSEEWLTHLKDLAAGFPIEFHVNVSYSDLCQLYAVSRLYWHAAGYGIDELKNPELTEHFGISTVEAISASCIPLVVPSGGQREIIQDHAFHWTTMNELIEKTLAFVNDPPSLSFTSEPYSVTNFAKQLQTML